MVPKFHKVQIYLFLQSSIRNYNLITFCSMVTCSGQFYLWGITKWPYLSGDSDCVHNSKQL